MGLTFFRALMSTSVAEFVLGQWQLSLWLDGVLLMMIQSYPVHNSINLHFKWRLFIDLNWYEYPMQVDSFDLLIGFSNSRVQQLRLTVCV